MQQYLTIDEYEDLGGKLTFDSDEAFDAVEYRARRHLDALTHQRLKAESEQRESVKRCMAALIDMLCADDSARSMGVSGARSVSNDGVSVSWGSESERAREQRVRISEICCEYLFGETDGDGVFLLYAGVD